MSMLDRQASRGSHSERGEKVPDIPCCVRPTYYAVRLRFHALSHAAFGS